MSLLIFAYNQLFAHSYLLSSIPNNSFFALPIEFFYLNINGLGCCLKILLLLLLM